MFECCRLPLLATSSRGTVAAWSHCLPFDPWRVETVDCVRISILHPPLGLVTQSLWWATVSWDVLGGGEAGAWPGGVGTRAGWIQH